MKHILPLIVVLLLSACCKDDETVAPAGHGDDPTPAYTPKGNLVIFVDSLERLSFADIATSPDEGCTHLCYAVYDMDGTRIKQTNQKAGDSHYGAVGFQLEEDTYQLVVLAHSGNKNPTMTNPSKIQFSNATGYSDTYLYHATVEVSDDTVTLHPVLHRVAARCRFCVSDTIPGTISQMRFRYSGGSAHVDAATGQGVANSTQEVIYDVPGGVPYTCYDLHTFTHGDGDTLHLTATALDGEGNSVTERQFEVPVHRGHITWFAGSFFSTGAPEDWTIIPNIAIDSHWAGDTVVVY